MTYEVEPGLGAYVGARSATETAYDPCPTVRTWTDAELDTIESDPWLATLLLNASNYTAPMIAAWARLYPSARHYLVTFTDWPSMAEPFMATDDDTAVRYALQVWEPSEIETIAEERTRTTMREIYTVKFSLPRK